MKRLIRIGLLLVLLLAATTVPATAKAPNVVKTNIKVPADFDFGPYQCLDEPEMIHLSGAFHIGTEVEFDGSGGYMLRYHENWQGLSATGLTTGRKYNFVGAGHVHDLRHPGSYPDRFTNIWRFQTIGQGGVGNGYMRGHIHMVVNANGEVTAEFERVEAVCK
jgi:hypothetical protein